MAEHTRDEILRCIAASGRVQLAGADLSGLDLSGLTLAGADFSYSDLTAANLANAQLPGASLWSARAKGTLFRGAILSGANLGLARLQGADLRGAQLDNADLTGAQLDGADLTGARMHGAWLDAMQRALAIGAPPLRFPEMPQVRIRVLHRDDLPTPITLRCGDRLELRLDDAPRAVRIDQAGLRADAVLVGPERPADPDRPSHLTFAAVSPGRAQIRIEQMSPLPLLTCDVMVTA